jgi:orotate phosphoribosyltransferase
VGIDRLGGTEVGGIPLVVALSLATGLPFVMIRAADTAPAATADLVRGELHGGERVLLVQDVVDNGLQAMESAARVEQLGARVAGVLSVIDRESRGARNIADAGYKYDSLFRLGELGV